MSSELREWLDDEMTRRQLNRLYTAVKQSTNELMSATHKAPLDELRERAGYRRGLLKAWSLMAGKAIKDDDEDGEAE